MTESIVLRDYGVIDSENIDENIARKGFKALDKALTTLAPEKVIPFHFKEAAVNLLTIDALDPIAKIPELKVCAVKIEKLTSTAVA